MAKFSNQKVVLITATAALFMFAFSFALAPLYRVVCQRTNFNDGINIALTPGNATQPVLVQFLATNNANLPWDFYPVTREVIAHPEQLVKIYFYAKNNSKQPMTVQAVPSFTPLVAARYFHKVECFCFTQQTLAPGESKAMSVVFRLDHQLPAELHTITLAYTLFDVSKMKRITT